jgi:hypothetical protein
MDETMEHRTCVTASGQFRYGIHRPGFRVANLREKETVIELGRLPDGTPVRNRANFPDGPVEEAAAEWIFEIPNAFPFLGTTYILKSWADHKAVNPDSIAIAVSEPFSFSGTIREWAGSLADSSQIEVLIRRLPEPMRLHLAAHSTDPQDLVPLAELCCKFIHDPGSRRPIGIAYQEEHQRPVPVVYHPTLFEVVANNPCLPDDYKEIMVLRPGAQGNSEIVGEWSRPDHASHVYEYLRRNSYIPWGHYAANMAEDAIRYRIDDLTEADITGMRHLYYQRTYARIAQELGIESLPSRRSLNSAELESLRGSLLRAVKEGRADGKLGFTATMWGWNYGFDYAPSGYRLHASHQQIHQQYALVPETVTTADAADEPLASYGCGDLVGAFLRRFRRRTGKGFFGAYLGAIRNNRRMDGVGDNAPSSLVIHEDGPVLLFVPKAQISQWEVQLLVVEPVGNILEADAKVRKALDRGMLAAMKILDALGARMVTVIEYSKRFDEIDTDQHLFYAFLPRLPESPGAFSEAQLRWINGHYPEDFAAACRTRLQALQM